MTKTKKPTRIEKKGGEFYVYIDGKYYGWTPDKAVAVRMRDEKRLNSTAVDEASDLSLWVAWNDAVNSGATVLADTDGEGMQCIAFPGFWLTAQPDESGWDCGFMSNAMFYEMMAEKDDTLNLVFAEKPYVLE